MEKITPLPYQTVGVDAIASFDGRALLADEMGLGKTLQALWYIRDYGTTPAIIVCPASLKLNWQREARKVGMAADVLYGRKPDRANGFGTDTAKLLIINYDILEAWLPYLVSLKPKMLVLDECHFVQSRTAKRTKAARRLSRVAKKLIAISGTPLTNRPSELWSVLNMLDREAYPSFRTFAFEYCKPKRTPWGWDYSGAQNLRKLHKDLKDLCMIRRLKEDVLAELPEKRTLVDVLPICNKKEYEKASTDFVGWLREQDAQALKRAQKALAITKINHLKRLSAKLKLKALLEYFDNVLKQTDEKIVVSAVHHAMIDELMDHFGSAAVKIDGRCSVSQRDAAVKNFQNNPKVRVFVGQLQAAGVGLTLTASSRVYFAEMGWKPGDHQQMADRVHRIGQKNACSNTYLVAAGTIEENFCKVLQKKSEVLSKVMQGKADIGDGAIYDQLMDALT